MPTIAITRAVSPSMQDCELEHLERVQLHLHRLREQHAAYVAVLRELGCEVVELPALEEFPDSVFVEDPALIFDEFAILTRPGAESRRAEPSLIADALSPHRKLFQINEPATLDGGDVFVVGKRVFVGASNRSNEAAFSQLNEILEPRGYELHRVAVRGCLHLKSAATWIGGNRVLVNPEWVDVDAFAQETVLEVDPSEPAAANAVVVGGALLHGAEYPRTRARIEALGVRVIPVAMSEIAKAEGALSCCSLLLTA